MVEQMFLRSVASGANSLEILRAVLGFEHRLLLDLCIDMLSRGYLQIDRESSLLLVEDSIRKRMGDPITPSPNWSKPLTSGSISPDEIEIYQELVSGSLFRIKKEWESGKFKRAPENPHIVEEDDISKHDLMLAIAGALSRGGQFESSEHKRHLDGSRVVDVTLKRATGGQVDWKPRSILVTARCFPPLKENDYTIQPPQFSILEPDGLSRAVRRRIAVGLSKLWELGIGRGRNQFFTALKYETEVVDAQSNERSVQVAMIAKKVEQVHRSVLTMSASNEQHVYLENIDSDARTAVALAMRNKALVELVDGAAEHHEWTCRALHEATVQVIIVCPWVRQLWKPTKVSSAIAEAVKRGVQVHILWGISRKDVFEEAFNKAAIEYIETVNSAGQSTGGRLHVAKKSAACHGKLVTCDLDWMLIGSCNILSSPPDRSVGELGILIKVSPESTENRLDQRPGFSPVVAEFVAWCRGAIPDYRLRPAVLDAPPLFGRSDAIEAVPVMHEIEPANWDNDFSVRIWQDEWRKRFSDYLAILKPTPIVVEPVVDGEHRHLLFEALANAKERIAVASPHIGIGLLGHATLAEMRSAVERGIKIMVLDSGEPNPDPKERQRQVEERDTLHQLASLGLEFREWNSHAKILLVDNEVSVGSFNYLSFEGYYDRSGRARHELSARVQLSALADQVWGLMCERSLVKRRCSEM